MATTPTTKAALHCSVYWSITVTFIVMCLLFTQQTAAATCGCVSSASLLPQQSPFAASAVTDSLGSGAVRIIEGDILISASSSQQQQRNQGGQNDSSLLSDAAIASSIYWPNGTLYYSLSSEFAATEVALIDASLRKMQLAVGSAVTFEKVAPGQVPNYVSVVSGSSGCNSYVGRQTGAQTLNLQRSVCMHDYIIQHEFIHALGYWHEQSRFDRDGYIKVWWAYIDSGRCSNFGIFGTPPPTGYPAYDTKSIMHYDSFAFSCDGSAATITSQANELIQYPMKLAESDLLRIHYLYGPGDGTTLDLSDACVAGCSVHLMTMLAAVAATVRRLS